MEQRVTLDQAQTTLDQLIDAAVSGATVLITKDGALTVQLVPVTLSVGHPTFGSGRGLMNLADDFDEPRDDFAAYMR